MSTKEIIIAIIFVFVVIALAQRHNESKRANILKVFKNGKSTIGYFKKAIKAGGAWPGYPDKTSYYFCTENDTMHGLNRNLYPPPEIEATIKKGDKFLVLYLEDDPGYSRILFDYPIQDSLDFQNYKMSLDSIRTQAIQKWKESLEE